MLNEGANDRLEIARSLASTARDSQSGASALVNQWREVSKPRKGGAIALQPPGCKVDSVPLFEQFWKDRGLGDALQLTGEQNGWNVYRYVKEPVVKSEPDWEPAFHGTWWYAVWMILESGVFLESNNRALGHDYWEPGVYCSPNLDTGVWYARPQIMFGDGVYHRVIFEVRADPKRRMKNRKRGGVQWVFPCAAVALHAVWVRSNCPPANGEERVNGWQPELEAIPPGSEPLPAIINPRKEPWPHMVDPFAWDHDGESGAPPWMRGGTKKASGTPQHSAKHALGGLYGHWLTDLEGSLKQVAGSQPAPIAPVSNGTPAALRPRGSLARVIQPRADCGVAVSLEGSPEGGGIISSLLNGANGHGQASASGVVAPGKIPAAQNHGAAAQPGSANRKKGQGKQNAAWSDASAWGDPAWSEGSAWGGSEWSGDPFADLAGMWAWMLGQPPPKRARR